MSSEPVVVCARQPVARVKAVLPARYIESMEQNQLLKSCCRQAEEHEVEALQSRPDVKGPDLYVFHCKCGRKHRRLCVGNKPRPVWNIEATA